MPGRCLDTGGEAIDLTPELSEEGCQSLLALPGDGVVRDDNQPDAHLGADERAGGEGREGRRALQVPVGDDEQIAARVLLEEGDGSLAKW